MRIAGVALSFATATSLVMAVAVPGIAGSPDLAANEIAANTQPTSAKEAMPIPADGADPEPSVFKTPPFETT